MTLVVNLYAGPGAGKSTTAAGVFAKLKQMQVNCELATEFAKDLTWEDRKTALGYQPYVIGKQMYKIHRLLDKVDVVITDSPILLTELYEPPDMPESWGRWVYDQHKAWKTLDIFLVRDPTRAFNHRGRNQTQEEALCLDWRIQEILKRHNILYWEAEVKKGDKTQRDIADLVQRRLFQSIVETPYGS